ncbi:MAG: ABC transporter permease [Pseudomonadota bacterium]
MNTSVAFFLAFLKVDLSNFCRNKTAAFWTFGFPLLLLIIFMGSFGSSSGLGKVSIRFEDQDRSAASADFIAYTRFVFSKQKSIDVAFDREADDMLVVVIPARFKEQLDAPTGAIVRVKGPMGKHLSNDIAAKILASVGDDYVLRKVNGQRGIAVVTEASPADTPPNAYNYPAYLVTGLLCMVVISTSLMGFVIPLVSARQQGHYRIFELVPAARISIVLALSVSKFIVIFFSGILLFVFGATVYKLGLSMEIGRYANGLLVLVTGVLGFLALALVVAAKVKTSDWANIICNLMYFPLILLGNLFIPVESSPGIGRVLDQMPVNLFVKALRGTVLGGDPLSAHAGFFLLFSAILIVSLAYASRAFVLNRGVE